MLTALDPSDWFPEAWAGHQLVKLGSAPESSQLSAPQSGLDWLLGSVLIRCCQKTPLRLVS